MSPPAAASRRFRPKALHTVERKDGRQLRYVGIALLPPEMAALPLSWEYGESSLGKPVAKVKEGGGKRRPSDVSVWRCGPGGLHGKESR